MSTYKTPNVYVEESPTLPPSVAEVSTAIPAFIGYTKKAEKDGKTLTNQPTPVRNWEEYKAWFGEASLIKFPQNTTFSDGTLTQSPEPLNYLMYYAVRLYFDNGGGRCYIISIGNDDKTKSEVDFETGLKALKKEDEPTLIMLTDATTLSASVYYNLCKIALEQCHDLQDRFAIIDVVSQKSKVTPKSSNATTKDNSAPANSNDIEAFRSALGNTSEHLMYGAAYYPYLQTNLRYAYTDETINSLLGSTSAEAKDAQKNALKAELDKLKVVLPPSSAVAGVYARVDRNRGVWKAPANESLVSVIGPVVKITNEDQNDLNIDATSGKSINAIRSFTGKGTLIWGARTLVGNSNEWRYISVRRLFNLIEESIQKATLFAVFEPNTALTWLKVKTMIESYLDSLWQQGAFAGATAEQAYFVSVGLGKTMTEQDVLEGNMKIQIGVAAVRPAEFIILNFSHKLQEA